VNKDRIVRFDIGRSDELLVLWMRLWGGAANCILTDESGVVIDALYRRPNKNEVSGAHFWDEDRELSPEENQQRAKWGSRWDRQEINDAVAAHYAGIEEAERKEVLLGQARKQLRSSLDSLERRRVELGKKQHDVSKTDRYRHFGDLLLANYHRLSPGQQWIEVDDYDQPGTTVSISLDPSMDPQQNAERYYDKAKRASRRARALHDELANLQQREKQAEEQLARLPTLDLEQLRGLVGEDKHTSERVDNDAPGLSFSSHNHRILVGRNSRENDQLLRRHVRGNDLWLHARDYPGGYVFVKTQKGKSVPLDVLLDAGTLAVYFSKARPNGKADLYYTSVKYLRRSKDGPVGLVLPTQEKNLHIELDDERLNRLLGRGAPSDD
jgi:predicted ribosome quality control (RQC) complex YloA/Tae2 family protein